MLPRIIYNRRTSSDKQLKAVSRRSDDAWLAPHWEMACCPSDRLGTQQDRPNMRGTPAMPAAAAENSFSLSGLYVLSAGPLSVMA